jgi:hypothetical protein
MSDPRTFQIPTPSTVDCESCSWPNPDIDIWDDIRTGEWEYTFECAACGHLNKDHGNALDRGAANVLFTLWITGAALLVLGILGHSDWTWPLILGGGWLVAVVSIIALFVGAKQGENR